MHWGHLCPPAWEHTHTCSQAQWIVYIFELGAKVQRHKQETGSPSLCPTLQGFSLLQSTPSSCLSLLGQAFPPPFQREGQRGGTFSLTL